MKIEQLTKEQIELQAKKRDEWIDIALHEQKYDKEEIESSVKWLYYASNLKEPKVVIVESPEDFSKKFKASVGASVRASVGASVWDSVVASVRASVRDSVWASVRASVRDSVRDSVWDSVWDSVAWTCLSGDAEFGAWYEYWQEIGIIEAQEKADKYAGFLRSGIFYIFLFEKVCYVMLRPKYIEQDEQKRLHSDKQAALIFADGQEIYKLHGVTFEKEWWSRIVNDEMSPEEILAIDNLEHRRIAWEYMDKKKLEGLKDFEVLDEQLDNEGFKMRVIQFNHPDAGLIRYYNCFCPTTMREYYIGTEEKTCILAKNKSFGLEEIDFINEW